MSRRKKTDESPTQVRTADAFSNPLYRIGFGSQAPLEATEYPLTRMTQDYAKINSMYRSEGILQTIIDVIPGDMTREWFTLQGDIDLDKMDEFDREIRRIGLKKQIIDGLKWGRLYGGAAGIILIKGQEDQLDKPLKLDSIMPGSFKGLYILDRWSGIYPDGSLVSDFSDPDFNLPEYYNINTADGSLVTKVHHSRVVRFTGRTLPFIEAMAEMYWGESEIEPIYEDIVLYDSIMANMGNLTFRANVDVMEVANLDQLFSTTSREQQQRFWNVMQAQSVAKSNFGMQLVNKGDQISNHQYTFTGFNYVTEAAQLNLCAKTHIPMTKLFGRAPAGLSATGEGDMKNYYDIVDGERESKLRPAIERILPVLCMSVWGEIPKDISISFPPLWTPNAVELATIAQNKANTLISAFSAGAMDLATLQRELKKLEDETGMFGSIPDEDIDKNVGKSYKDVTALADPMAGLTDPGDEEPVSAADAMTVDYNENHGPDGRFASGGNGGKANKLWTGGKPLTYLECRAKLKIDKIRKSTGWTSRDLKRHFNGSGQEHDHMDMYPGWNIQNYESWSVQLLENRPYGEELLGFETDYTVIRYFAPTNDFVKENKKTGIITMFKPNLALAYYEDELNELKKQKESKNG